MNIPNLIISSFDSTYDQFHMIPEVFSFISKKAYHTFFINESFMISLFLT